MTETLKDLHFPKCGIDVSQAFSAQPNRPGWEGEYARTTPLGVNVRGWEALTNRVRGGVRMGLSKYLPVRPGNVPWVSQDLNTITTTGSSPVQTSQSGRVVNLVTVSQGNVFYTVPGAGFWTQAVNMASQTPPLNFSGLVYSAANQQKLYYADGIAYVYFDPIAGTVNDWKTSSSGGQLPIDSKGNTARLIATWRGRTVLSGLIFDPQNWFMSAVGDPTNFNYSPQSVTPAQAIAGNNSPLGLIGDAVTTLIPYSDDVLMMGGDHTIWMFNGDPMAGGQIDLVSDAIGMAWGIPWCKDPFGTIYFVSNKTGIYTLVPGQQPQRISQPIEQLLHSIDTGQNGIRLLWSDRYQGLHVFITPLAAPAPAIHFFYEARSNSWWQDVFANNNHNPLCCCTYDGNSPTDRVPLIGSWDGYVRAVDAAVNDDGTPINSAVLIGPLLTPNLDELLLKDIQGILGETSGQVNYAVFVGSTAEKALQSTPVAIGTWNAGRNLSSFTRFSGHAIYLLLSSTNSWAMESVRVRIAGLGKVRRRGV